MNVRRYMLYAVIALLLFTGSQNVWASEEGEVAVGFVINKLSGVPFVFCSQFPQRVQKKYNSLSDEEDARGADEFFYYMEQNGYLVKNAVRPVGEDTFIERSPTPKFRALADDPSETCPVFTGAFYSNIRHLLPEKEVYPGGLMVLNLVATTRLTEISKLMIAAWGIHEDSDRKFRILVKRDPATGKIIPVAWDIFAGGSWISRRVPLALELVNAKGPNALRERRGSEKVLRK